MFKEKLTLMLHKLFQKLEEEKTLSTSLFEDRINMIPKSDNDIIRKEYYRPIFLKNINVKILNKIEQIEFSNIQKGLYIMTKWNYLSNKRLVQHAKIN